MSHLTKSMERSSKPYRALAIFSKLCSSVIVAALAVAGVELIRIYFGDDGPLIEEIGLLVGKSLGVTTVVLALLILTLRAFFNRLSVAILTCVPFAFGLLVAHIKKQETLGKPLVPADLGLIKELWDVLGTVIAGHELQFAVIALVALSLIVIIVICLVTRPRWPLRLGERFTICCFALVLVGSEIGHPWFMSALEKAGIHNLVWSYGYNLRMNGFLLSFLMNARQVLPKPNGYGARQIAALFENLPEKRGDEKATLVATLERPDVIVYMAEAFWDVTKLDVHFSRDPIPNFHALATTAPIFSMTSPQRGGGTANVEFEALTGIPHGLLPPSAVPYQHYIHRPLRALPALFKEQGYTTTALHNFHRYYFSRASVYPLLGFDRFITLDEMAPLDLDGNRPEGFINNKGIRLLGKTEALIDGQYPSDEPLVRRLIEELDAPGNEPRFLFAIGMVGHGPFLYERWPEPDVTIAARDGQPPLSEEATRDLENMANAAFRADKALGYLVRALERRPRPTLLVFFGDHLPALRSETFAATGFESGEYDRRRFETQVLFWSNRSLPEMNASPAFSVFYLSPKILNVAGIDLPRHLELLASFEKALPSLNDTLLQSGSGVWSPGPHDEHIPMDIRELVDRLSLLTYDRLAGQQLSESP